MATLEILATAATVAYVVLAVKRSLWQYPIGLFATALFFVVFAQAKLYSSTALQVVFALVQLYGWWYWLRGDAGRPAKITSMPLWSVALIGLGGVTVAAALSGIVTKWSDARMAFTDATIFALSTVAQFLVGRKIIENWIMWMVVDALAILVYASQDLWVTAALYCGLFASCFWGYHEWRNELRGYDQAATLA